MGSFRWSIQTFALSNVGRKSCTSYGRGLLQHLQGIRAGEKAGGCAWRLSCRKLPSRFLSRGETKQLHRRYLWAACLARSLSYRRSSCRRLNGSQSQPHARTHPEAKRLAGRISVWIRQGFCIESVGVCRKSDPTILGRRAAEPRGNFITNWLEVPPRCAAFAARCSMMFRSAGRT